MFDKLVDLLISFVDLFRFFVVIRQWEEGIILRFGKYTKKILKPGFHFIWPFSIDEVHTIGMLPGVLELEPQTIMTKDRMVVVIQAIVKYQVSDSETCLVHVANEMDAVKEFTQGAIHTVVSDVVYTEVNIKEMEKAILKEARKEVNIWGIKMHSVTIKSFGKMSSIRLIQ